MNPLTQVQRAEIARGERTLAQVVGMTPEEGERCLRIACELAEGDRLDESRRVLEGLCLANPREVSALVVLGTVYERLGRWEEALEALDAALELVPSNAVALAKRGELRLRLGEADGVDDLRQAIRADPSLSTGAATRAKHVLKALASTE